MVVTKEQLVVCKGSCDGVFHLNCVKKISARLNRQSYFCPKCLKKRNLAAKKLKQAEMVQTDRDDGDDDQDMAEEQFQSDADRELKDIDTD